MKSLRPIAVLGCGLVLAASGAAAQVSLTPPGAEPPPAANRPAAKPAAKPREIAKESAKEPARKPAAATPKPNATPAPAATATPAPVVDDPHVDLVYGAFQRGQYKTAFDLATQRVQEKGDPKAMTMLGELYSNAFGVKRDYAKAIEWYRRASDAGDREAMFALAMLRLSGQGGPNGSEEAAKLLASSAKLGSPKAAYNLALLYID
jgi:hypothetical protein